MTMHSHEGRCAGCINRREFLSSAAGAAGLVVLAGCGDGFVTGPFGKLPNGPITIALAAYPQLATTGVLVQVTDQPIGIKRTGASTFQAFSMICTHQGCTTAITNGQQFDCGCHGSRFGSDGTVLRGPNTGESITPLPQLPTTFNATDNTVTIG